MNRPPDSGTRVPPAAMESFVAAVAEAAGLASDLSATLASLLTQNDLRGVWSHGTRQVATYARLLKAGTLNPRPRPTVVKESPVSVVVDGDGSLGYFAALKATRLAIDKAQQTGIALGASRNHGHFGAAGIYARMPLQYGLVTFVTSGHQLKLQPGGTPFSAGGGSPMAFSAPAGDEDPLVLDFGALHDLYAGNPYRDELMEKAPGLVLRAMGLGTVCQSWGGLLTGLPLDPAHAQRDWEGANQGALIITFRPDLVSDGKRFQAQVAAYSRAVAALQPVPGYERAYLPGGVEAEQDRVQREKGILLADDHRAVLEEIAGEVGVATPWAAGSAVAE